MKNYFDSVKFCATLKVWRKLSQFTIEDMSELTSIPRSTYAFIENGDRPPTLNEFTKLCRTMDFECSEFFSKGVVVEVPF